MCGIFGWQFTKHQRPNNWPVTTAVLQLAMEARGDDSWGWATGKKLQRGLGRITTQPASDLAQYNTLIGHTRKATHGSVSVSNAHPFLINDVVGAHNGIIYNHDTLNATYHRDFPVDSMHIFAHIAERRPLNAIHGYGAIHYYHRKNPNRVFLGKFSSGDLCIYGLGDKDAPAGVVWASTEAAITRALALAGLSGFPYEVKNERLYRVEHGTLWMTDTLLPISGTSSYATSYPSGWDSAAGYYRNSSTQTSSSIAYGCRIIEYPHDRLSVTAMGPGPIITLNFKSDIVIFHNIWETIAEIDRGQTPLLETDLVAIAAAIRSNFIRRFDDTYLATECAKCDHIWFSLRPYGIMECPSCHNTETPAVLFVGATADAARLWIQQRQLETTNDLRFDTIEDK